MARKTGVLDSDQQLDSTPKTFLKKSVADLLVRRAMADRISNHLIRRRPVNFSPVKADPAQKPRHFSYIPQAMPAPEIPGLMFQLPLASRLIQANSMVTGFRKLVPANY